MDTFALILNNLVKHYRSVPALNGLDLSVKKGELLCLVGPSGSGKTTAMHVIAGLIELDSGDITLFGQSLAGVAPKDRDVAMVFQDGALYPHLTVQQNLAFPLWARDKKGSKAVPNMARRLEIEHLLDRYPSQISGGEARRVALGRALIRKPKLFLLDEPLSGLDAPLRDNLRGLIRELVTETGVTTIYVTHDQGEAMAVGDRLAVMQNGQIRQCGSPRNIYENPENKFIARFFGTPAINLLEGRCADGQLRGKWGRIPLNISLPQTDVLVGIRPEHLEITDEQTGLPATVNRTVFFGHEVILVCELSDQTRIRVRPGNRVSPGVGEKLYLTADSKRRLFFDSKTGKRI